MTKSKKKVEVLTGAIRGGKHQRTCQVEVVKVTHPVAGTAYKVREILDLADNFPDDDYELTVGPETIALPKRGGKYVIP